MAKTTDANPPMPDFVTDYELQEVDASYLTGAVKPKQFLHIDQADRPAVVIEHGNLVEPPHAHEAHRVTHQIVHGEMLWARRHHFANRAIQTVRIFQQQAAQVAVGENSRQARV